MKTNMRSVILVVSGIAFMIAMDWMLGNILYAIIYGVAFSLILGSYLYQEDIRISLVKKWMLHSIGIVLLCLSNILVISNMSAALLISAALSLALSGTYWTKFSNNN